MQRIKEILLFFISRIIILFIVLTMILYFVLNFKQISNSSQLKVLNRLRPENINNLIERNSDVLFDRKEKRQFRLYYDSVYRLMPDRIDALGISAYCDYLLGDTQKSLVKYEKLININPNFFWFYYNAGILNYKQGNYKEALDHLNKALISKPEHALAFISMSQRIYLPILIAQKIDNQQKMFDQIKAGYRKSYLAIIDSYNSLKQYDQMMQVAAKAIQLQLDERGEFYYLAGLAAYNLNKFDQSVFLLNECIKKNNKYKKAYSLLADILTKMNNNGVAALVAHQNSLIIDDQDESFSLDSIDLEIY